MADTAVLQPGLQQPGWQVDRFIVSTALLGLVLLGGLIWLETAPFMVALFVIGTLLGMALVPLGSPLVGATWWSRSVAPACGPSFCCSG